MEKNRINNIGYSKYMINKKIYIFLYYLIKAIFLKEQNTTHLQEITKQIKSLCDYINKNIIKNEKKFLSMDYNNSNLLNILKFIRMQNEKYAVEIYENLLIIIFSFAFETEKKNNFGKYIYNNLRSFKNNKNNKQNKINELDSWIKKDKFKELFNIYNNKVKIIDLENQKISIIY